MDYREIRILLERYWDGKTSVEDEKKLKDFFSEHHSGLPDDLKRVADLFGFFANESIITTGDISLPDRESLIWEDAINERKTGKKKIVLWMRHYWQYAAIFLLLLGSVLWFQPDSDTKIQDTYQRPEQAYATTQKALQLIATTLNNSKEQMQKLALFKKAQEKVTGASTDPPTNR